MTLTLHEIHAVQTEGFHLDESLGAADFGLGDVVDEHVSDGAFAIFDVWVVQVRIPVAPTCRFSL